MTGSPLPAFALCLCLKMLLAGTGCCAHGLRGRSPYHSGTATCAAWGRRDRACLFLLALAGKPNPNQQARQTCSFSHC